MAANPFDEFDAPVQSGAANPFDEFDSEEKRQVAQENQIRREMAMSPEEYDKHIREKVRAGGYYRPQPGQFGLLSDQVTDAIGFGDEIAGAGQFLRRLATSGGSLDEAGKAYTDAAERIRAERRVARKMHGVVPEIVGGMGTATVSSAPAATVNFLRGLGQTARAGATAGAVSGAAQGEGGVINRAGAAIEGGITGGILAPAIGNVAIPAAARLYGAGRNAVRYANQAVRSARNPEQAAIENVADRMVATGLDPAAVRAAVSPGASANLQARGFTDDQIAEIISRSARGETNAAIGRDYGLHPDTVGNYVRIYRENNPTPLNIIDIAKETAGEGGAAPLTRLGRAAYSLSGDESGGAAQRLMGRQDTQAGRVSNIVQRSVAGGDFEATRAAGLETLRREADQAYRQFYAEPELAINQLDDLMEDTVFRQAVGQAEQQARVEAIRRNQQAAASGAPQEAVPFSNKNDPQIARLKQELEGAKDNLRDARRRRQDAASGEERRAALEESRDHEDAITAIQREIQELQQANPEVFSPEMLDLIQRQLRIASEGAVSNPNVARHAGNLREVFLDRIEQHYPTFRGIRRDYAAGMGEFGEEGALQAGRELTTRLGANTDEALRGFADYTPAQQDLFRLGFARRLMDMAADPQIGGAVANKFNTTAVREIVERLYPQSNRQLWDQGQRLLRDLRREAITTRTKNDVLVGARSAELDSDMARAMEVPKAAAHVATGRWGKLFEDLSTRLSTQLGSRGAREVMDILTQTDPARLLPLLNRLDQAAQNTAQRQQLVQQIRALRGSSVPGIGIPVGEWRGREAAQP